MAHGSCSMKCLWGTTVGWANLEFQIYVDLVANRGRVRFQPNEKRKMSSSMLALNAPMLRSVESLKPRYAACRSMRPLTLGVGVGMRRPSRGGLGRVKASATHDTEGTISNNLGADAFLVTPYMNYSGSEDPTKPYPVHIQDKQKESFKQLADNTSTSAGALAYRAQDENQADVNVIIAWKYSPLEKRVFTEIDDADKDIDWNTIKVKLENEKDRYTIKKRGVTSAMKWIYGSDPHIDVHFHK